MNFGDRFKTVLWSLESALIDMHSRFGVDVILASLFSGFHKGVVKRRKAPPSRPS